MKFTKTKEEYEIVKSVEESVVINTLQDLTPLLNVVSKWRVYLGISKEDMSEELAINSTFICENYGHLTLEEIKLAYILSITGKLDDISYYGSFSPIYIAKVLNSYLHYRKITLADTIRRREMHIQDEMEKQNKPTPKEQAELTKEIFADFYSQWKESGEINDVFNICYNFLRKQGAINPNKEEIELAMQYGVNKAERIRKEGTYEKVIIEDIERENKRWARNWCVQNYFKNVDINVLLNNIKEELFS